MFNFLQMFRMMGNLPKITQEFEQLKERLNQLTAEGDAGAGMVRVKVNGKMQLQAVTLSDEAVKGGDKELLEELILAATNQAIERVRELIAAETQKMATALGLPPGMNLPLPGLS